jgi:hypothetical protein
VIERRFQAGRGIRSDIAIRSISIECFEVGLNPARLS